MNVLLLINVYASSSEGDLALYALAAGPLAGIAFFSYIFRRYRNIDKRHKYEHSPHVRSSVTKTEDRFLGTVKESREARVRSENYENPTWRIGEAPPLESSTKFSLLRFFKAR